MPKDKRLYKRKGSHIWIGVYYERDGTRRIRSTKTHDRTAAEIVLKQWERDAADPADAAARKATMSHVLELLIRRRTEEVQAGKKSPDTVEFYRAKAGHVLRVFEYTVRGTDEVTGAPTFTRRVDAEGQPVQVPFPVNKLTANDIDDYISLRRSEGASENTISKELVTIRAALKLAKRRGWYLGDPAAILPVAFAPEYKPRERFLTVPELQKLLAELPPDRAARVAFAVATSANWGETNRAQRAHVEAGLGMVHIDGTKRNSRKRDVPIVHPLGKDLIAYALKHAEGQAGKLFLPWSNVRRDLIAACERAGIAPVSTNDLRRTYSIWLKEAGVTNSTLFPTMGHTSAKMLEKVYGRLKTEQLRSLMQKEMGMIDAPKASAAVVEGHFLQADNALPAGTDCNAFAANGVGNSVLGGFSGRPEAANPAELVPRGGIEPPTRGFSVPSVLLPGPRKDTRTTLRRMHAATHLQQEESSPAEALTPTRGGRKS
jgi:integrase